MLEARRGPHRCPLLPTHTAPRARAALRPSPSSPVDVRHLPLPTPGGPANVQGAPGPRAHAALVRSFLLHTFPEQDHAQGALGWGHGPGRLSSRPRGWESYFCSFRVKSYLGLGEGSRAEAASGRTCAGTSGGQLAPPAGPDQPSSLPPSSSSSPSRPLSPAWLRSHSPEMPCPTSSV